MLSLLQELVVSSTYPPTLSLWLLLCAGLMLLLRRRRLALATAVVALGWPVLWSVPQASDWLRGHLENRYPVTAETALPHADAIVVLGGGHYGWLERPEIRIEQLESSRVAAGARAWQAGRAPIIIVSGGGAPGQQSEARTMAHALDILGVPPSAVVLEEHSRDTRDNARFIGELTRQHRIDRVLLVTSSLHMPRASLIFRQTGIEVIPLPVPEAASRETWQQRWLPSRRALWRSGRAWKEYLGLIATKLQARM